MVIASSLCIRFYASGGVFYINWQLKIHRKKMFNMSRHVLSILVENQAGVLSRVSGLFSRRGYNIDSLSVGITNNPDLSRITIVANTKDDFILDQIKKQLNKLIDVVKIIELKPYESVYRELALIKVKCNDENRTAVTSIVDIFRAKIVDVSSESLTIEITGDQNKLKAFIELMNQFGIKEIVRTGLTALERGPISISEHMKYEDEDE